MSPIVEAIRAMQPAPALWYRNGAAGVWFMRGPAGRLGLVYGAGDRWWWRWNPTGAHRCTRSIRRAMLECQRAAVVWVLGGGGWRRRRARRAGPTLTAADIDHHLAAAPAIVREVTASLVGVVSPCP